MTWYYVKDGQAAGPVTDGELLSMLRLDSILPTTLVWKAGMAEWQAASIVAPQAQTSSVATAPDFAPTPSSTIDAPPELISGTPPVLPNFFCTFCGTIIPADQLVRISGRNVCGACKPSYVQQVREGLDAPIKAPVIGLSTTPFRSQPETDLADPGVRFIAYIVDWLFIMGPILAGYILVALLFGAAISSVGNRQAMNPTAAFTVMGTMMTIMGLAVVWMFFYWTYFIGKRGATPGMKIMKIKMVCGDRTRVSYGRAFGRALLLYVLNSFTMGLTNISAFFDREKRTVTDMMCDTRVVRN